MGIPKLPFRPQITAKTWSSCATRQRNYQIPRFQKLQKESSRLRSCTLCVQGSAQKQHVA